MRIVIVPGTNRAGSLSAKLATQLVEIYQQHGAEVDRLNLELGPEFLAPEAYRTPGPTVKALVARFLASDGAVFIVPEYNGSYPGILKLFIDMLPYPQGFEHRPCAFIGLAAGQFHGLRAVEHLQGVTGYRHAHNYPIRVFIGDSKNAFTPEGRLASATITERIAAQADGFLRYITGVRPTHG